MDAIGNVWGWCLFTHAVGKESESRRRAFGVFGGAFNVSFDPRSRRSPLKDLFAKPPAEFEYTGELSIGFRCALAKLSMDLPSVVFSRTQTEENAGVSGGS
jgi:hypothetical protein